MNARFLNLSYQYGCWDEQGNICFPDHSAVDITGVKTPNVILREPVYTLISWLMKYFNVLLDYKKDHFKFSLSNFGVP